MGAGEDLGAGEGLGAGESGGGCEHLSGGAGKGSATVVGVVRPEGKANGEGERARRGNVSSKSVAGSMVAGDSESERATRFSSEGRGERRTEGKGEGKSGGERERERMRGAEGMREGARGDRVEGRGAVKDGIITPGSESAGRP